MQKPLNYFDPKEDEMQLIHYFRQNNAIDKKVEIII